MPHNQISYFLNIKCLYDIYVTINKPLYILLNFKSIFYLEFFSFYQYPFLFQIFTQKITLDLSNLLWFLLAMTLPQIFSVFDSLDIQRRTCQIFCQVFLFGICLMPDSCGVSSFREEDQRVRVPFSSHHIKTTHCQHDLSLLTLTLITYSCLINVGQVSPQHSDFSFPFHSLYFSGRKSLREAHT